MARMGKAAGLPLVAVLGLGGCTSLGSNIAGDFSCPAPDGVCAPTEAIDATAVDRMRSVTAQPGGIAGTERPGTALIPGRGPVVPVSAGGLVEPVRSDERIVKVVFPARIDASGLYHAESSVYAVVEGSAWTEGALDATALDRAAGLFADRDWRVPANPVDPAHPQTAATGAAVLQTAAPPVAPDPVAPARSAPGKEG